jgi:hypothetical protein
MNELIEAIEDSLNEIIEDSIDMDWTSRWGAKAITRKLKDADEAFLRRLDELLVT